MENTFTRKIDDKDIDILKNSELFCECLKDDIDKCEIFPAIRNNEIDFYYNGGRLFRYKSGQFYSNVKYSFVCLDSENNGNDISEKKLKDLHRIDNFKDGYNQIKCHCEKYNQKSIAFYVSRLFKKYSYKNLENQDDIVLLDIESAFSNVENIDGQKKVTQDRFDIVLLNKKTNKIKVVEAKLYSNDELHNLSVVNQIHDYEKVITKQKSNIITAYNNYLDGLEKLFGVHYNKIDGIENYAGLLFFDYDIDNRNAKRFQELNDKLKSNLCEENKIVYIKDPKDLKSLEGLF